MLAGFTTARLGKAERLLKSVVERDPSYAPAYAALAGTYQNMASYGALSPSEASARMMPLVEQALSLDDGLAEAWQHLAYVRTVSGDLEGVRVAEGRAMELDPQNPVVLAAQLVRWLLSHEPERALVYADELLRIDPLSPSSLWGIAILYLRLDRFDDSERTLERIRSIDPQHNTYLWGSSSLAVSRGNLVTVLGLLAVAIRKSTPSNSKATARSFRASVRGGKPPNTSNTS